VNLTIWGQTNKFTVYPDGTIISGNQYFSEFGSYVKSEYFKSNNMKCGTRKNSLSTFRNNKHSNNSDCSLSSTLISDEYRPNYVLYIPVVFHNIFADDSLGYLPEERFTEQINVMNEAYRAKAGSLSESGFDTKIEFILVGVNRVVNSEFFDDYHEYLYKEILNWDPTRFLNIYTNTASGYLGYAYLPQDFAGAVDGIVLNYEAVGGRNTGYEPYDQGHTFVHECGHYFGLLHTFEGYGCFEGYEEGDLINDTYPENTEHYGCSESNTCDTPDNIDNFMNYTDDLCMVTFTEEQANRMRCGILNYRQTLPVLYSSQIYFTSYPVSKFKGGIEFKYLPAVKNLTPDSPVFNLISGPEGMQINQSTGELTWMPEDSLEGKYYVEITVTAGNEISTQRFMLFDYITPRADFYAQTRNGNAPLEVTFNNQSAGDIVEYIWNFGDDSESSEENPSHIYENEGTYTVNLIARGLDGKCDTVTFNNYINVGIVSSVTKTAKEKLKFALHSNYPNPFNPSTKITYTLPEYSEIKLSVFDVIGREIRILENTAKPAGTYTIDFNAGNLPGGIYFYRIQAGGNIAVGKMTLLK